jgi:molybdenum cofactor cytidylyltransferase
MKFGPVPVSDAEGALLVHGQTLGGQKYRKGRILTAEDISRLAADGVETVTVAIFEDGDVGENDAARRLADAMSGDGVRAGVAGTGRVNLFAMHDGIADIDPATIDKINAVDEGITASTLHPWDRVETGQVVATVKIIPFAVAEANLVRAEQSAFASNGGRVGVRAYAPRRIALVQTRLPGLPERLIAKAEDVVRTRVEALGSELMYSCTIAHTSDGISDVIGTARDVGADIILVVGASATTDRRDVVPAGIEMAGGHILHFGMPVDPGNLTVLAELDGATILALPGSARSSRPGGNDILLERILAGIPVDGAHIMRMGVGGLLKEIPSRPLPRMKAAPRDRRAESGAPRFAAVILAAGQSRRMGAENKLLIPVDGKPMIRHAIDAATQAGASPVIVVTGHEAERVAEAAGEDVVLIHNPDYATGLSSSLKAGLGAVPDERDGALVALGDMPRVGTAHLKKLIAAFDPDEDHIICVPTWNGKRGNPVLWDRQFFEDMAGLGGDVGAKHLIGDNADVVCEVPMDDDGVLLDVDSPEALNALAKSGVKIGD